MDLMQSGAGIYVPDGTDTAEALSRTTHMGIGAHQARDYARALGGQLDVTSTSGSGTVFNFRLPLSPK